MPHSIELPRLARRRLALLAVSALMAACGGGGGGSDAPPPPPPGPTPPPSPAPTPGPTPAPTPAPITAPVITRQPLSQSVAANGSASFSVELQDAREASYQWLRDGATILGATQAVHTTAALKPADNGSRYSVRVTNPAGTVLSAEATLTVTGGVAAAIKVTTIASNVFMALAADAPGNAYVAHLVDGAVPAGTRIAVRKFGLNGNQLAFGPPGATELVLQLPAVPEQAFTSTVLMPDGTLYAATSQGPFVCNLGSCNPPRNGRIYRMAPNGSLSIEAEWPTPNVAGAVAPMALAVAADGTIHFMDAITGNLVRWTSGAAAVVASIRPPLLTMAPLPAYAGVSITIDAQGTIYVLVGPLLRKVQNGALVDVANLGVAPVGAGSAGLLSTDAAGNVYVVDRDVLHKVTPDGTVSIAAGKRGGVSVQEGAPPGSVGHLHAATVDAAGRIHAVSLPPDPFFPTHPNQPVLLTITGA